MLMKSEEEKNDAAEHSGRISTMKFTGETAAERKEIESSGVPLFSLITVLMRFMENSFLQKNKNR